MDNGNGPPDERPATWENELVGETKKLVGHALHDEELTEEGEDQIDAAHEVRAEYVEKHDGDPPDD